MSARSRMALTLIGAASLAGCGALGPYATYPAPEAPTQPAGARVAICYNGLRTSRDAAREEAQKECPADTTAERVDTDHVLEYCPLLLPTHATYACTPAQ